MSAGDYFRFGHFVTIVYFFGDDLRFSHLSFLQNLEFMSSLLDFRDVRE
jgi:hypothetical protein